MCSCFYSLLSPPQVSIHSVWLGNNITPLREEEWGEDEEDEADTPAPTSPPVSPINSRSVKETFLQSQRAETSLDSRLSICAFRKHRAGVDIHSCSQFLLELYSQWLIPGSPSNRKTPTILVSEVVRSVSCTRLIIILLVQPSVKDCLKLFSRITRNKDRSSSLWKQTIEMQICSSV